MASSDNQSGASRSSGASGSTSSALQSATSAVSDIAQQAGDRVRDQASRAAGQVQEQSQAFLAEQKEAAATHIEGVAKVLHDTVDQLRQRSPGVVTDYAERAVGSLDSFANTLRERDVRDLVGQVEDFARRQPVLFLAGSVVVGFALARFLKSSSQSGGGWNSQGSSSQYGSRGQSYGGSSYGSTSSRDYSSGQQETEYGRHIATESTAGQGGRSSTSAGGSDYRASGSRVSGVASTAPAIGSGDGPASPQYSTTQSGRTGTSSGTGKDRRSGQESD